MKPTRPLETFDKWYRHQVTLTIVPEGRKKVHDVLARRGLKQEEDYLVRCSFGGVPYTYLYFDRIYDAAFVVKRFTGRYYLYPEGEGPLRNKPIFTHFTMDDLKTIFGDPLPLKIQYLLTDLKRRGINYFSAFHHMHQVWNDRDWWPAAFVYQGNETQEEWRERILWCQAVGIDEVATHACKMWEFGSANDAMLFKLRFGEDALPHFYSGILTS